MFIYLLLLNKFPKTTCRWLVFSGKGSLGSSFPREIVRAKRICKHKFSRLCKGCQRGFEIDTGKVGDFVAVSEFNE